MAKRRAKNRLFANGRNATSTNFLMMDNYVFDCPAYRALACGPRSLLWELIRRYNGSNNGQIGLGVRDAAKCLNVTKDTASAYFRNLIESGFIAQSRPGGFNIKDPSSRRASEWRLTWLRCNDQPPTKEFMEVSKKIAVQKTETLGPRKLDTKGSNTSDCPENLDLMNANRAAHGRNDLDTYTSSHRQWPELPCIGWWQPDWTPAISNLAYSVTVAACVKSVSPVAECAA